jgi:Family of unknown function (DUF5343)
MPYFGDATVNDNLPYMVAPGSIPKIMSKIQEARRPERFTQDFLETMLGFTSSATRPIISLLKRIGFLNPDGSPTRLYDQFRNPNSSGSAMAEGLRIGYKDLYDRNEFAHALPREKLNALIIEMTGAEKDNRAAQAIAATFWTLKELADFDARRPEHGPAPSSTEHLADTKVVPQRVGEQARQVGFNVAYTINLNLPETTNPEVFNAIFRALKDNLLE